MLVVWVNDVPLAVTVMCELPVAAPDPLVKVRVEDLVPSEAKLRGLKLAVMPAGNPETDNVIAELKPPNAAVVNCNVPRAVVLTVTPLAFGVSEKPGTFTARVCLCVTPPPLAVIATE
jgi:hypothetical protein